MATLAGWREATIEALAGPAGLMTDGDWIESKDQDVNGGVRLVQLADIGDGEFLDKSARFLTKATAQRLNCTFLQKGDVLIARMPDPLGRACIFPGIDRPAVAAVDICIWRGDGTSADAKWLTHAINSPGPRADFEMMAGGTTRQRISGGNLKRYVMPVPPMLEQRRLAAWVDSVISASHEASTNLTQVIRLLRQYKLRYLASTLDRVGGEQVSFSDVSDVVTGTTPPKKDPGNYGSLVPFIKPTDLDAAYFVDEAREWLSKKGAKVSRLLPAESTLVTCIGATIGKTGFSRMECATNQQINALVPDRKKVDPRWLYWWTISEDLQQQIRDKASATTLPIINKGRFEKLQVAVPQLSTQRDAIGALESCYQTCANAQSDVERALRLLKRLKEQALRKLFDGSAAENDDRTVASALVNS